MTDSKSPDNTQHSPPPDEPGDDSDEAYCAACNQSFTIDAAFCPNDGAKLVKLKARKDDLIGRVFDNRYEIRAALGHGGMGTVYRGWQLSVDREVAIKVIHPKLATERSVAKRFLREARLASRLSQANIVNVYDFGQSDDGILYLVMELLRGKPLAKDLEGGRPLPMKRIKAVAMQMCDALDAAHAQGIVHRDLKPGNIVLLDDPPGRDLLKILDFGLAKSLVHDNTSLVTKTDAILGTPLYMPPEQILGKPSDHTADLYSLGCIMYQLAMGKPPYIGENINVVLAAHVRDPVPRFADHVPDALAEIIYRLMDKDPGARIQSARTVHEQLAAIADDASTLGTIDRRFLTPRPGSQSESKLDKPHTITGVPKVSPVSSATIDRPPRRRWMLPVFGLLLAGGVAALIIKATSTSGGGGATQPSGSSLGTGPLADSELVPLESRPPDDGPADALVDKLVDAKSPIDAKSPFDAKPPVDARPAPADARVRPPVDARPAPADARIAPVDARILPPDAEPRTVIDAPLPVDAGAPKDAKRPDIDLLPTKKPGT